MKQSFFAVKTDKNAPHDEGSINAQLLTRGGFVKKESAGVFSFLPIGLRVLQKIKRIIREEMNAVDMQEILMPALIPKENWQQTGRDNVDIGFKTDRNYILGWSHEEIVTPLSKLYINSYKDLPVALYQIQTKFRNEPRAKSGLLRGREFSMKDGYSFHLDREDFQKYYDRVAEAYFKTFERAGLKSYKIEAGGGEFSKLMSHEFAVITPAGEDVMLYCSACGFARNAELRENEKEEPKKCEKCGSELKKDKCVEVGNIFDLATKYSDAFNLKISDKDGKQVVPYMGCYGIGVSRLMGTIVEAFHDENGIIWPKTVAPFQVHIISLNQDEEAKKLEKELEKEGFEVLFDDRDESAGKKFADSDLIGIPLRIVISGRTIEKNSVEWKERAKNEAENTPLSEVVNKIKSFYA